MKSFRDSTKWVVGADQCAGMLLETVPQIMRAMRLAIGGLEAPALTVPQFRTLHFVQAHCDASLSATAEFLGLTLPSTSKLVDQLVKREVLIRNSDAIDRRRMTLRLTAKGNALLKGAQLLVRRRLAETLHRFGTADLAALHNALGLLQESFPPPPPVLPRAPKRGHPADTGLGGNAESEKPLSTSAPAAVS